jgi:hypothetical protein
MWSLRISLFLYWSPSLILVFYSIFTCKLLAHTSPPPLALAGLSSQLQKKGKLVASPPLFFILKMNAALISAATTATISPVGHGVTELLGSDLTIPS